MLTLEEDILYCKEKAKICRELAILYKDEALLRTTYYKNEGEYLQFESYLKELKRLRESERPKGEWVVKGQDIYCSVCNQESAYNEFGASKFSNFCPSCGADMRKPQTQKFADTDTAYGGLASAT